MALLMPYHDTESFQSEVNASIWDFFSNHTDLWIRLPAHEIALKCLALVPIMVFGVIGNVAIVIVFIRMKVSVFIALYRC